MGDDYYLTAVVNNPSLNGKIYSSIANVMVTFIQLTDTPNTYVDYAGMIPVVNDDEDGLHFESISSAITDINWGDIEGNLPEQPDLYAALLLKADISSLSSVAFSGEYTDLLNRPDYMLDLVDDVSPQLGGDLVLNGMNISFPTINNISDCLDEDLMNSNSATALATQQSIKSYVDANAKDQRSIQTVIELPTAIESISLGMLDNTNGTITAVRAYTIGGGTTVTLQLEERNETSPNTSGVEILSSSLVADNNEQVTTTFDNANITGKNKIHLLTSAISGSPIQLVLEIIYNKD